MTKLFEKSKTYKPFHYPWAVDLAREHDSLSWHEDELRLQNDVLQWNNGTLSRQERGFIKEVLSMFTQSDVAVGSTYKNNLIPYIKNNEVNNMLTSFAAREGVHQRAYALLNETLGLDDSIWSEFLGTPEYEEKIDRMESKEDSIKEQVGKLALSEGVSLFASFIMLLEFGTRGKMLGMCEAVEWSIRDETMHVKGNTRLYKELNGSCIKSTKATAEYLVELEDAFIDKAYSFYVPEKLPKAALKQYIRYITDRRLQQMGISPIYNVSLPAELHWVDAIISGKSDKNFFEGVVTDYTQSGMKGDVDWGRIV